MSWAFSFTKTKILIYFGQAVTYLMHTYDVRRHGKLDCDEFERAMQELKEVNPGLFSELQEDDDLK